MRHYLNFIPKQGALRVLLAVVMALSCASIKAEGTDLSSVITSKPANVTVTIANDDTYPWSLEDGVLSINNTMIAKQGKSYVTFTVTCEKPTRVQLNYTSNTYGDDKITITAENHTYSYSTSNGSGTVAHYLDPGVSTLKIGFEQVYSSFSNSASYSVSVSDIQFMDMDDEAIKINLSAAGNLGQEAIAALMESGRGQSLPDMKYLKLTGPMNSADWDAISKMTSLYYIDMAGTTVTDIPASAFTKTSLYYIVFPTGLKTIGKNAFESRYLRGHLTFPATLESIGNEAFYRNQISSLVLPNSLTEIGTYAFRYNTSMKTLQYPTTMTSVPGYCFDGCTALQTVAGLDNVKTVDNYAFNDCKSLVSVGTFQPTTLNDCAFNSCNKLQAVDLSQTTSIGSSAFTDCDALTEVDFTSLTSIGSSAFYSCDGLTSVTFNDKITEISSSAFSSCTKLATINLGASVRKIGIRSFICDKDVLTAIYLKSPTPPTVDASSDYYYPFYSRTTPTLYVPDYAMVSYKLADYWSAFNTVEANPNMPEEIRLYGNLELTSNARIPNSPDVQLHWASSSAAGASFVVNGDKAQPIGDFLQNITHYKYGSGYDPNTTTLISRCANMSSTSSKVRFWCDSYSTYWYYICMPFDVEVSSIYTSNDAAFAVRYYDGANRAAYGTVGNWKDVPADGTLEAGKGYIFCASKSTYIYLPATEETHNQIFTPAAVTTPIQEYSSQESANAGWNLVGNPYPAFYDIYYMDYTAPITVWNTQNKTFSAYSIADDDFALYPLQAFFVQKPNGIDAVTFQPNGRQRTLTIEHATAAPRRAAAASSASRSVINLSISNGITEDMTRVVVNASASDDYEAETDAAKMMSLESTPQLYSIADDIQYAINEGAHGNGMVQLGFWVPAEGEYTVCAQRADIDVELYDNGKRVEMPYTFSASQGTDDYRFSIKFSGATGITNVTSEACADNSAVFDLSGRRVSNPSKGIYIINKKKVIK